MIDKIMDFPAWDKRRPTKDSDIDINKSNTYDKYDTDSEDTSDFSKLYDLYDLVFKAKGNKRKILLFAKTKKQCEKHLDKIKDSIEYKDGELEIILNEE
jgi:hypothetical protein